MITHYADAVPWFAYPIEVVEVFRLGLTILFQLRQKEGHDLPTLVLKTYET
ncbi:hypothetical protein AB3331_07820 [Streptococcus sp. H49]|uniref:hypothetical protein n=1 Tax=Streptococcus huangxiaojuni TaxID=3237239 RepID=UPI0034A3A01E